MIYICVYIYIYIYIYLTQYFDILITSQRGSCVICRRKPFHRHTTDDAIGHSGGNERKTYCGNRLRFSSLYKAFVRSVVVWSQLYIRCIKCMELLFFDNPARTDIVRRSPICAYIFVSTSAWTQTRDLPYSNRTIQPLSQ